MAQPPGRDLACSVVLHTATVPKNLCSLSMAVALGVADLLHGLGLIHRPDEMAERCHRQLAQERN